jgi:predicted methyltransferase
MDALENLYDGLQPGGWLIVDDHDIAACRHAIADFRSERRIDEPIIEIDSAGICWQRSG